MRIKEIIGGTETRIPSDSVELFRKMAELHPSEWSPFECVICGKEPKFYGSAYLCENCRNNCELETERKYGK